MTVVDVTRILMALNVSVIVVTLGRILFDSYRWSRERKQMKDPNPHPNPHNYPFLQLTSDEYWFLRDTKSVLHDPRRWIRVRKLLQSVAFAYVELPDGYYIVKDRFGRPGGPWTRGTIMHTIAKICREHEEYRRYLQPHICCPECRYVSWNMNDIQQGYCAHCCSTTTPDIAEIPAMIAEGTRETPSPTASYFEVVLTGYKGDTNATDHLVLWFKAETGWDVIEFTNSEEFMSKHPEGVMQGPRTIYDEISTEAAAVFGVDYDLTQKEKANE